jgi:hypothetical protein
MKRLAPILSRQAVHIPVHWSTIGTVAAVHIPDHCSDIGTATATSQSA